MHPGQIHHREDGVIILEHVNFMGKLTALRLGEWFSSTSPTKKFGREITDLCMHLVQAL